MSIIKALTSLLNNFKLLIAHAVGYFHGKSVQRLKNKNELLRAREERRKAAENILKAKREKDEEVQAFWESRLKELYDAADLSKLSSSEDS